MSSTEACPEGVVAQAEEWTAWEQAVEAQKVEEPLFWACFFGDLTEKEMINLSTEKQLMPECYSRSCFNFFAG